LPVTSPTFAAGEELPASKLSFLVNKPAAQLYSAAAQSIPNSAFTALTFDSERFDVFPTGGAKGHSTSVNPSRYTVVTPGVYRIGGRYTYAANATGFRAAVIAVNGIQLPDTLAFGGTPTASLTQHVATQGLVPLNLGDYVEILVEQTSGAPLNTDTANSAYSSMSVEWVR